MPAKVRVYELARELDLSNNETLDLCESLGIDVKSHSSSIVDAQADRVRRRVHRERESNPVAAPEADEVEAEDYEAVLEAEPVEAEEYEAELEAEPVLVMPDEPEPVEVEAEAVAVEAEPVEIEAEPVEAEAVEIEAEADEVEAEPVLVMPDEPEPVEVEPEPVEIEAVAVEAEPVEIEADEVEAEPVEAEPVLVMPDEPEPVEVEAEAVAVEPEPVEVEPAESAVLPDPDEELSPPSDPPESAVAASLSPDIEMAPPRVVTSSGGALPRTRPRPMADDERAGAPPSPGVGPPAPPRLPEREPSLQPAAHRSDPPLAPSGKPIPPPPGKLVSRSGKPIPPPPGRGGRGPTASPRRSMRGPAQPGGGTRGPSVGTGSIPSSRPPLPDGARGGPGAPAGGPGGRGRGGPQRPQQRRRKGRRRRRVAEDLQPMNVPTYAPTDAAAPVGEVVIERASTPLEVGPKLNQTAADVVRFLMQQGEMVTATQSLTDDMIELFAAEVGADIQLVDPGEEQENELLKMLEAEDEFDESDDNPVRPPVITVMGHVDHGKTKLLDQIRNAKVAEGEAGGITQHIGAYQVEKDDRVLTFIDTPGHAAFTAMRARGADATDIVVLVVAADDGVMPQTLEAINHARAADVPIVVAVNKIDRNNADPNRTMQQLSELSLVPEQWGGETIMVEMSALQNLGIDDLLEHLAVVAEVEDLRANPEGRARGVVLESNLDIGRGPVATLLVQQGTLRRGDPVVAGASWGRVRALLDDRGNQIEEAQPSKPVQVLGLSDVATAGDMFLVAPNEKVAAKVAQTREHSLRLANLGRDAAATSGGARLEDIFKQIQAGETATLNLIVKADVNGSLEAVVDSLQRLGREDVKLAFVHRGVGGVTANDIQLAAASNATIIGFNVRPDRKARQLAEAEKVEIRTYEIIYNLIEDVENAMVGMLAPEFEEVVTGDAEVREIFRVPRVGAVAGCYVLNGTITRGSKVRFLRDGTVIWRGVVSSLKRFKDDAREVQSGYECGIGLSDFQDLKQGDVIETFEEREVARV